MQNRKALGKGLDSLIPPIPIENPQQVSDGIRRINIDNIVPSPLQPRMIFDEESIKQLAISIKEKGIIQPLIVSKLGEGRYELVAGERRLRASRLAGVDSVPVIVKDLDPQSHLEMSIVENVQREDLNPIEEANAYNELFEKFNLSHDEIAQKVGKSRTAVTNSVRLLKLPKVIQEDVSIGRMTAGHARALLGLKGIHEQLKLREEILKHTVTVRDVEKMVQLLDKPDRTVSSKTAQTLSAQLTHIVEKLRVALGAKVKLNPKGKGGTLTIEYYSTDDLNNIYKRLVNN